MNLESTGVVGLWWSARGARGSIRRAPKMDPKMVPKNGSNMVPKMAPKMVPKMDQNTVPKMYQNTVPKMNQNTVPKMDRKMIPKMAQNDVQEKVDREGRGWTSEWLPGPSAFVWKSHYEWSSGRSRNSIGRVTKS